MSFENRASDAPLPKIEALPANEIVTDPNHAWHAVRGYDFAGVEKILNEGLTPSDNQGNYAVCLSASPAISHSIGREANSFYGYSLQDGITLSVATVYPHYPSGDHCGFLDEVRVPKVAATQIDGIMLPAASLDMPLTEVATVHEQRKPKQAIAYNERTLRHLEKLGVVLGENELALVDAANQTSLRGEYISKDDTQKLEKAYLAAYSRYLEKQKGVETPTVRDMLSVVLDDTGRIDAKVYGYDENLKREVGLAMEKIGASKIRNNPRMLGSFSFYDSDSRY